MYTFDASEQLLSKSVGFLALYISIYFPSSALLMHIFLFHILAPDSTPDPHAAFSVLG